jgi:hypothetical protein
LSFPAAVLRSI